jgi:hypothetical protein
MFLETLLGLLLILGIDCYVRGFEDGFGRIEADA